MQELAVVDSEAAKVVVEKVAVASVAEAMEAVEMVVAPMVVAAPEVGLVVACKCHHRWEQTLGWSLADPWQGQRHSPLARCSKRGRFGHIQTAHRCKRSGRTQKR